MTFYWSHLLVHYQFSYQIAFHLVLNQGTLACEHRLLHFTSNSGQEWRFPQQFASRSCRKPRELQPLAESIPRWSNLRLFPEDMQWANGGQLCGKYWFLSLGFRSFSSNNSPKGIWTWVTPAANPAIIADTKSRRPRTNYKGAEKTGIKKPRSYTLEPTGSSLYDD